jgi:hypothetical protein
MWPSLPSSLQIDTPPYVCLAGVSGSPGNFAKTNFEEIGKMRARVIGIPSSTSTFEPKTN